MVITLNMQINNKIKRVEDIEKIVIEISYSITNN